jgi:indolepyruvate ferredoxin oxidoreductase alpha subunit
MVYLGAVWVWKLIKYGGQIMRKMVSGNEAAAYAALNAGAKVISGYPGTPSSEVIIKLLKMKDIKDVYVEWSINEKVAVEVAAAAAWAGQRTMCTMKMSGLNVAYDSLIGFAYSGTNGGFVIYVADDPGVTTGMAEQDTRGFALMSDMVMLEPSSVQESYDLVKYAFELSEAIHTPVFVRTVTNVSQSYAAIDIDGQTLLSREGFLEKDINKYTKAGEVISTLQHKRLINSLEHAALLIEKAGLNELELKEEGGPGVIAVGVTKTYVDEALEIALAHGCHIDRNKLSLLKLSCTSPFPQRELKAMLKNCSALIVWEELEGHLEKELYMQAYKEKAAVRIIGKNDGVYTRFGEYNAAIASLGFFALEGREVPSELPLGNKSAEDLCAARPITVCAGCPHRGTYMAINSALKKSGYKKDACMVTGDVGCTILGINPPFHTLWTEIAMGASIPVAQGYKVGGIKTPVIATIGDSTFFHGGIPGLINAIHHGIDLTVIIMDNGWTAMTGMQVNPGTSSDFQEDGYVRLDLEKILNGLGVEHLFITDPYDLKATEEALEKSLKLSGVKVVLTRRECAIQAGRRKGGKKPVKINNACIKCKICVNITGCPALSIAEDGALEVDVHQCNGCGICAQICPKKAIEAEAIV